MGCQHLSSLLSSSEILRRGGDFNLDSISIHVYIVSPLSCVSCVSRLMFPVLVMCHYELICVQVCLCDYVLIIPCI